MSNQVYHSFRCNRCRAQSSKCVINNGIFEPCEYCADKKRPCVNIWFISPEKTTRPPKCRLAQLNLPTFDLLPQPFVILIYQRDIDKVTREYCHLWTVWKANKLADNGWVKSMTVFNERCRMAKGETFHSWVKSLYDKEKIEKKSILAHVQDMKGVEHYCGLSAWRLFASQKREFVGLTWFQLDAIDSSPKHIDVPAVAMALQIATKSEGQPLPNGVSQGTKRSRDEGTNFNGSASNIVFPSRKQHKHELDEVHSLASNGGIMLTAPNPTGAPSYPKINLLQFAIEQKQAVEILETDTWKTNKSLYHENSILQPQFSPNLANLCHFSFELKTSYVTLGTFAKLLLNFTFLSSPTMTPTNLQILNDNFRVIKYGKCPGLTNLTYQNYLNPTTLMKAEVITPEAPKDSLQLGLDHVLMHVRYRTDFTFHVSIWGKGDHRVLSASLTTFILSLGPTFSFTDCASDEDNQGTTSLNFTSNNTGNGNSTDSLGGPGEKKL